MTSPLGPFSHPDGQEATGNVVRNIPKTQRTVEGWTIVNDG
jgi:hypothetical protein